MEGFLLKKGGSAESTFGRRNWKKRWFELEGTELKYYENFDQSLDQPSVLKGTVDMYDSQIDQVHHRERQFVFSINHVGENPLILCADDEKTMNIWIQALRHASTGGLIGLDYEEYYEILGLREEDEPDLSTVNKAYRKAALKVHPDKGGDIAEFKRLQEAFKLLTAKLEEEEADKGMYNITYEAIIQKGGKGVGFGMVVVEDPKKGSIYIKEVLPTMRLELLGEEAGGEMKAGDVLVSIGNDDITCWPLIRVVQRLNDFRIPVDTEIKLTFSRKVPMNSLLSGGEVDEERGVEQAAGSQQADDEECDIDVSTPVTHQHDSAGQAGSTSTGHSPRDSSSQLNQQVTQLQGELQTLSEENSRLKAQLEQSEQEKGVLASKLKDALKEAEAAAKREAALRASVQHLTALSNVPKERLERAKADTIDVADLISSGNSHSLPPPPDELEEALRRQGLSFHDAPPGSHQSALRTAQIAASAVDPSGQVLNKWQDSGDAATDRLLRLEGRLSKLSVEEGSPEHRQQGGGGGGGSLEEGPASGSSYKPFGSSQGATLYSDYSEHPSSFSSSSSSSSYIPGQAMSPQSRQQPALNRSQSQYSRSNQSAAQPSGADASRPTLSRSQSAISRSPSSKSYMTPTAASSRGPKSFGNDRPRPEN